MIYPDRIHATRRQITKCMRNVAAQRERVALLEERGSDTWAARGLLKGSEASLHDNREQLRSLLDR